MIACPSRLLVGIEADSRFRAFPPTVGGSDVRIGADRPCELRRQADSSARCAAVSAMRRATGCSMRPAALPGATINLPARKSAASSGAAMPGMVENCSGAAGRRCGRRRGRTCADAELDGAARISVHRLRRAAAAFPAGAQRFNSDLELQTLRVGLDYRLGNGIDADTFTKGPDALELGRFACTGRPP